MEVLVLLCLIASAALGMPCPGGEPCLWKCCGPDEAYFPSGCKKLPSPHSPFPAVRKGVRVLNKRPCESMFHLEEAEAHEIDFAKGQVLLEGELLDYCVELSPTGTPRTYLCYTDEDEEEDSATILAYSYGVSFSCPPLFITFLAYAVLEELRSSLHGKCVVFHTGSMFASYLVLALTQRGLLEYEMLCVTSGYSIQFFFMATFFWLNVMCFDIYWAFSGLRNLTGSVKERERKKLIYYSIYAWGFPFLILLFTLGIDYLPILPNDSVWKPNIGKEKCYFEDDHATGIFFYLPMGLIITTNIILFTITAFRIRSLRRETKVLKGGDSRKHDNTRKDKESLSDQTTLVENMTDTYPSNGQKLKVNDVYIKQHIRFSLYLKLFVVMGINWAMELISFLAGGEAYIWYLTDFTNTLQGLFIFAIFVWKRRVRRLIWSKIQNCFGKSPISNGSKTPWSGSTRYNSSQTNSSGVSGNSMKMQTVSTVPAPTSEPENTTWQNANNPSNDFHESN